MAHVAEEDLDTWEVDPEDIYEVPPLEFDVDAKIDDDGRKRRFSVSAEDTARTKFVKKVYKKSAEATSRIKSSVQSLFFWKGLDVEQQGCLIDAMFEKTVIRGEEVITQGDRGDYFYVIESGKYEVYKQSGSPLTPETLVYTYDNHGCFGELALMYNAPRAATVRCSVAGTLWAVDRDTFRHIIVLSTARKRAQFDDFIHSVEVFSNVDEESRSMITDTMEVFEFKAGDFVFKQGDKASHFHIVYAGTAEVVLGADSDKPRVVRTLAVGDYFGERAILLNTERSASVRCAGGSAADATLKTVAMDRPSFLRLMTSSAIYDKMRRRMRTYEFDTYTLCDDDLDAAASDDSDF